MAIHVPVPVLQYVYTTGIDNTVQCTRVVFHAWHHGIMASCIPVSSTLEYTVYSSTGTGTTVTAVRVYTCTITSANQCSRYSIFQYFNTSIACMVHVCTSALVTINTISPIHPATIPARVMPLTSYLLE